VGFLSGATGFRVDLYLHQQGHRRHDARAANIAEKGKTREPSLSGSNGRPKVAKVEGWLPGWMEFPHRALGKRLKASKPAIFVPSGHRSGIICNPARPCGTGPFLRARQRSPVSCVPSVNGVVQK
jgi:hypothetical protein